MLGLRVWFWQKQALASAQVLKRDFQHLMKTKSKQHSWPATTQQMEWQQIVATQWYMNYMEDESRFPLGSTTAWLSVLAGTSGEVVARESTGEIILILAVGSFGS